MNKKIFFTDLGNISYDEAFNFQTVIFNKKIKNKNTGIENKHEVLICEHPHVFTIGKSGNENNLLVDDGFLKKVNATYYKSDRGGDITYHGPGQLVVYPIIDLDHYNLGTRDYIYKLEYIIIDVLKKYGIYGEISDRNIGVWIDVGKLTERKLCSIGVKVSRGITMHGLALNVNTDLSYFKYINPCGFLDKGVTSMEKELKKEINIEDVRNRIIEQFKTEFK